MAALVLEREAPLAALDSSLADARTGVGSHHPDDAPVTVATT
jgi:hypothetical protein